MKTINKYIGAAVLLAATSLTSCVDDAVMLNGTVTDEQVQSSPNAVKYMALGLPSRMNIVWDEGSHFSFGYAAQMVIRDMMTGDYHHEGETNYSHFISWAQNKYMGDAYLKTQFHWNYYYGNILAANKMMTAIDPAEATSEQLGYYAVGKAYRAMWYLDIARMYEFLPNDKFDAGTYSYLMYKTVPLVDETTTSEEAGNNPRASHEVMSAFILQDLDDAEQYIEYLDPESRNSNTLPDLACVYGLKARLYMWDAAYYEETDDLAKAEECYTAAKGYANAAYMTARANKIVLMTENQATDVNTGFNNPNLFMWAAVQTAENRTVTSGIVNWTSWVSNQTSFGYTGSATKLYTFIDKRMYDRIQDSDWRKYLWVGEDAYHHDQNKFISAADAEKMPALSSLKFRPADGNAKESKIGAASAYPIMRVEEMYLIEAEAAAHLNPTEGESLLRAFMSTRDKSYSNVIITDVVKEILFQKSVELWGEGQTFFDIKRMNQSVTRGYEGTNWDSPQVLLNTNGRPAWTNFVMVRSEAANNKALEGMNNPDPTDCYTPWVDPTK